MDLAIWVGTISTVVGVVMTQGFSMLTQRRQLRTSRRVQWDKDIVRLAGQMIDLARRLLPIANSYWSMYFNTRSNYEEKQRLDKEIDAGMEKLQSLFSEIALIASLQLAEASAKFLDDCDKRFTMQFEYVGDDDDGRPIETPVGNDPDINIEKSIQSLIAAVQRDIHFDGGGAKGQL